MRMDIPWWTPYRMTLGDYTDEQLINELENRGYTIGKENE